MTETTPDPVKEALRKALEDNDTLDRVAAAIRQPTGKDGWERFGVRTSRKCKRPDGGYGDLHEAVDSDTDDYNGTVIYTGWDDQGLKEADEISDRENGRIRARAAIRALAEK